MVIWKDITSYSQGDKEKVPKTFEAKVEGMRIVVTRHIYHDPEAWCITCSPWWDCVEFCRNVTAEEAKRIALTKVEIKLRDVLRTLETN